MYIINFFSLRKEAKEQSKLLSAIDIYGREETKEVTQNNLENGKENVESESEEEFMSQLKQYYDINCTD